MLVSTLATKNDLDSKKDYKRLNSIMLTSDEWELIQDLMPVLSPFSNYCDRQFFFNFNKKSQF